MAPIGFQGEGREGGVPRFGELIPAATKSSLGEGKVLASSLLLLLLHHLFFSSTLSLHPASALYVPVIPTPSLLPVSARYSIRTVSLNPPPINTVKYHTGCATPVALQHRAVTPVS